MMVFSVARSTRLRMSTATSMPPAAVKSWVTKAESRRSKRRLDLLEHFGRRAVERGQALRHLHLPLRRKRGEDLPRLIRMEVSQDQSDRLGMFVLDEVEQLRRIGLAGEVKGPHLQGGGQPVMISAAFCGPRPCPGAAWRTRSRSGGEVLVSHGESKNSSITLVLRLGVDPPEVCDLERQTARSRLRRGV